MTKKVKREDLTKLEKLRANEDGRISLPHHITWNEQDWASFFGGMDSLIEEETRIFLSGLNIGNRCSVLWRNISEITSVYQAPIVMSSLVSMVNTFFLRESLEVREQINKGGEPQTKFSFENSVDIISLLCVSMQEIGRKTSTTLMLPDSFLRPLMPREAIFYVAVQLSEINLLDNVFQKCLFLGSTIEAINESMTVDEYSTDIGREYLLRSAIRESKNIDLQWQSIGDTKQLPSIVLNWFARYRIVTRIVYKDKPICEFGLPSDDIFASRLVHLHRYISSQYLFDTLRDRWDVLDVINAWDVIHSFCHAVTKLPAEQAGIMISADMKKEDFISIISTALSVDKMRGREIVEKLLLTTFMAGGAWTRPLIPIDKEYIQICYVSVLTLDPRRFLHTILKNFGLAKERGNVFEKKVLGEICNYIGQNPYSKNVYVLEDKHEIYDFLKRHSLQTDMIILVGNDIVVCEAKSVSHVATPREMRHAMESIKYGVRQVRNRINWMRSRENIVRNLLNIPRGSMNFFGAVITNDSLFDGMEVDGIGVNSLETVVSYVRNSTIGLGGLVSELFSRGSRNIVPQRVRILYSNDEEFVEGLFRIFKHSPSHEERSRGLVEEWGDVTAGETVVHHRVCRIDVAQALEDVNVE